MTLQQTRNSQEAVWRPRALLGRAIGLLVFGAAAAFGAQAQDLGSRPGALSGSAQTGVAAPGTMIEAQTSATAFIPTAAQIAAREQLLAAKSKHLAPAGGARVTKAQVAGAGGPETGGTNGAPGPQAAGTFTIFQKSLINSTCSGCGQSAVNEPSAANSGKTVIETSNWNIAYTLNGGASSIVWANQNPYSLSPGYCCDTQIVYDEDRDIFVLLLLDYAGEGASTNGFTLLIAKGLTPTTWCSYKFNGSHFGKGATDTLDFPKIALSNNNLFVTWNVYPPNTGFTATQLARMPLDPLSTCSSFGFNYLTRTTEFTLALSQQPGSHDTFYFVANWFLDSTTSGSNLRIFWWPDNSNSFSWVTRAINPFNFNTVACGTPDWCSRLDPRWQSVVITPAEFFAQANSAFAGDQILQVAGTAGPSNFSNGNNYVVYNYFKLNSLAYIGNDQTFNTSQSFAYPSCAVNGKGYIGCAAATGANLPGGIVILKDKYNAVQPWGFNFVVAGVSGASSWGDYTITNPWRPSDGPFQTVLWNRNGSTTQPYYVVWGRGADWYGYTRWRYK